MFLDLKPTLNKKEQWLQASFTTSQLSDYFSKNDEPTIFDTAKVLRKQNWLSDLNFSKDKPDTYSNIVYNKPVKWSPVDEVLTWLWSTVDKWNSNNIPVDWTLKDGAVSLIDNGIKPVLSAWLSTFSRVLDKPTKSLAKWITETSTVWAIWYYNLKELWVWIKKEFDWEWFSFDWNKASKDIEAFQNSVHYFYWTKPWFWDYINFNSLSENRKQIYDNSTVIEQRAFDKIAPYTIIPDLALWVLSWLWTSKAIWTISWKLWTTSTAWKVVTALDKSLLNPSLTNQAKVWVWLWALAIPYYGMTGKWLFEWDEQATAWASVLFVWAWLKTLWMTGGVALKKVLSNPEVKQWFNDFVSNFKNTLW
jgi:hypothetical protein